MNKEDIVLNILPYLDYIKDEEKIIVYQLATNGIGTLSLFMNCFSENTLWLIVDEKGRISEKFINKNNILIYNNFKEVNLENNLIKRKTYLISELCNNKTLNFCQEYYFKNFIIIFRLVDDFYLFPDRLRIKYYNCLKNQDHFILMKDNKFKFLESISSSSESIKLTTENFAFLGNILFINDEHKIKVIILKFLNINSKDRFKFNLDFSLDFLILQIKKLIREEENS